MGTSVWVKVVGEQRLGADSDRQERECPGVLQEKGHYTYLTYTETDADSGTSARVTVKLDAERLVMLRSGSTASRMVFQPETDTFCDYDTGAGILAFRIHTDVLSVRLNGSSGSVSVSYALFSEGQLLSRNTVRISFAATPVA